MAKRFTDTDKWKKPFLRSIKAPYKLLWMYIQDECDHAGIWQVDFEVAEIKIGEKLKPELAREFFKGRIMELEEGTKWFIYDFIGFQYGELNPQNRAHNSVIQILKKYNIDPENKEQPSPLQGAKDKGEKKEKELEKDLVKEQDQDFYRRIKHLKLTYAEFEKLQTEGWSQAQIDEILDQIENFRQNTKYSVLMTTARVWLRRHHQQQKLNSVEKKLTALQQVQNEYNESLNYPG